MWFVPVFAQYSRHHSPHLLDNAGMVTSYPALEAMGYHGEYVIRKKLNMEHFLVHIFIKQFL